MKWLIELRVRYTAYGFNNATLDCDTVTTDNPYWTIEEGNYKTITIDCAPECLEIQASQISAVA